MTEGPLELLEHLLDCAPVMGRFHPLVPLCLSRPVDVIQDASVFAEEVDALSPHSERPVLITEPSPEYQDRFHSFEILQCPAPCEVNRTLHKQLDYARKHLLTHRQIADRIVTDVEARCYEVVALLLVDGLSYDDAKNWTEHPEPCFVDGPSITYGLSSEKTILADVGFPGIVGTPPLSRRLIDSGIAHSYGYSYWDRERNQVSAWLFQGIPLARVTGMAEALGKLSALQLRSTYVQLVREGLDGLAHRRREVSPDEVRAATESIHNDYRQLVAQLRTSGLKGAAYLVADHGILWKNQHRLKRVDSASSGHPRYSTVCPLSNVTTPFHTTGGNFHLCNYPYLGANIRSNDSGVHGGLSYWESIVPFVRVEVNV